MIHTVAVLFVDPFPPPSHRRPARPGQGRGPKGVVEIGQLRAASHGPEDPPAVVGQPKLAQIEITLYRLANELKKTQRRANALSNIFIPEYRDTIKYLEDSLEEKEREELFQLKRVKNNR